MSYGKGDGDRETGSGVHVVQAKYPEYEMCNTAFNYCGVKVTWAVRINNSRFIHKDASTVAYQGIANVSHGCVNISTANDLYVMAIIGDPVIVSGTGPTMKESDYIHDWISPWEQWRRLSAQLRLPWQQWISGLVLPGEQISRFGGARRRLAPRLRPAASSRFAANDL